MKIVKQTTKANNMDFIKLRTWRWKSLNQLMVLCYLIVGLNVVQIFAAEDYQTNLRALDCQDAYGRPQVIRI